MICFVKTEALVSPFNMTQFGSFCWGPYHFRKTPPPDRWWWQDFSSIPFHKCSKGGARVKTLKWHKWPAFKATGEFSVSWCFMNIFFWLYTYIYKYTYIYSVYIHIYVVWPCGCSVFFISNIIQRAFGVSSQSSHVLRMGWNMSKPSAISIKKSTKHRSWELWAQLILAFWAICDVLSEDVVVLPTAEMFYIDLECFFVHHSGLISITLMII
jgi:hypothetical protein